MLRIKDCPQENISTANNNLASERWTDINVLVEREEFEAAYKALAEFIKTIGSSVESEAMAGLVAIKMDRAEQAISHFENVLRLNPNDYDAAYNLAILASASGNKQDALSHLRVLANLYPDDAGLRNDIAVLWLDLKRTTRAEANFRRALRIDPNNSISRNNAMEYFCETHQNDRAMIFLNLHQSDSRLSGLSKVEINRWKEVVDSSKTDVPSDSSSNIFSTNPKVGRLAVFANQRTFITPITDQLSETAEIRYFEGSTIDDMKEMLAWADIAWFEWCDDLLIAATTLEKNCKIICRLHSYEAFTDMPKRVDWSKVDGLIFVNESVRELVEAQVKNLTHNIVIHNGVDLNRFEPNPDKSYGKKIASVGYINYKKNPSLLLYCFKKIHDYDPEYSFHVAGTHQDPRITLYFSHFLKKNPLPISFDNWVDDIPRWMKDKDYVISTSLFESFHYSIAEGMASGLMPLIHDWYGSTELYSDQFIFSEPDSCLDLLKRLEQSNKSELAVKNRELITKRYDLREKNQEIMKFLYEIANMEVKIGAM